MQPTLARDAALGIAAVVPYVMVSWFALGATSGLGSIQKRWQRQAF